MKLLSTANLATRHTALALLEGLLLAIIVAALLTALAPVAKPLSGFAGTVDAGKPGGGSTTSTIRLVLVNETDGVANQGDHVSFTFSGSYSYPAMSLQCSQGGNVVYGDSRPMYWPNPWNDPGVFTLSSMSWTSGAADCTAALKVSRKNGVSTVASLKFHVDG